jgi:hypothetical protein
MKRYLHIPALAVAICSVSAGAHAETVCKREIHKKFDETRIYSRAFIAACKPGARCRIVTHRLSSDAPLGFSHTFAFQRANPQSKWQVMLVDVLDLANTQAGFELTVDKNPAMKIVPEHVSAPVSVNEYALNAGLTDLILTEAKPGDSIRWSYVTVSGEQQSVAFSLSGLTNGLEWAECAQALLVSGKSDPTLPAEEKPEYSPPEKGVPVDPVGDGRD